MATNQGGLNVTAVELVGARVKVHYNLAKGGNQVHEPARVRLRPDGLFLIWDSPPANLKAVSVEWEDNPFTPSAFQSRCRVTGGSEEGVQVVFEDPPPAAWVDWFAGAEATLNLRQPDASVTTSKLYTRATVVSASGLLCGALAILMPLLVGDRAWVDIVAKLLLAAMVASIAGFAWIRSLAGKAEVKAIGQSRG